MKRQFIFIISQEAKDKMSIDDFVQAFRLRALEVKSEIIGVENITEEIAKSVFKSCDDSLMIIAENYTPTFTKDDDHYFNISVEI